MFIFFSILVLLFNLFLNSPNFISFLSLHNSWYLVQQTVHFFLSLLNMNSYVIFLLVTSDFCSSLEMYVMVSLPTCSFPIYTTETLKFLFHGRFLSPAELNPVPRQDYHLLG